MGRGKGGRGQWDKDQKFYCVDYNRGKCMYPGSHEGKYNSMTVQKLHMCKVYYEKEGVEVRHPENSRDCKFRVV